MTSDVLGFTVGAAAAGVKDGALKRTDVALIVSDRPCAAVGVFTTNQVIAAPCVVTRRHLERGTLRAIVVNSGNANACTGEQGERDAVAMAAAAAEKVGCDPHEIAVASTGVIGVPLPLERIATAVRAIAPTESGYGEVAEAIMTTDTRPKSVGVTVGAGGADVIVHGIAKGAGMIHPNMATLLAFVLTDAAVPLDELRALTRRAAERSVNAVSVGGHTSTDATPLVPRSGGSGAPGRPGTP